MQFKNAWVLLFIPVVFIMFFFFNKMRSPRGIRFSSLELLDGFKPNIRVACAKNLIYMRALVIAFFLIAMARPRTPLEEAKIEREGIDIVLAIDASGSMLAEDFEIGGKRLNRLDAVKNVVNEFINMRKSDRIGMVAFASQAYTVCPLTLDYDWLLENLKRVKIGAIEDGTAIGSAIGSSLNRLKDTESKSKIIILLTDGINNTGTISPATASQAARSLGVKIYTIGAGTKGLASYPMMDAWGRTFYRNIKIEIDEETLKDIARETGGRYFRATDAESLRNIYQEIDRMETTPVEEEGYQEYRELFWIFLLIGLMLLMAEIVLSNTVLRVLP
ncbi:MAG: VWA domain-containing protein [Candidatus Omnitrophica bacterium]|nr:VWA domain-containing protein [Candidatus Omnitrophota bacterium]